MTLPKDIPEPWKTIHEKVIAEQGPEWAEKYGEASLRAAMFVMGDTLPEEPDPDPDPDLDSQPHPP